MESRGRRSSTDSGGGDGRTGDIGALYGGDDCDASLRNLDEPILGGVAVGDDGAVVHGVADDTPRGVVFL